MKDASRRRLASAAQILLTLAATYFLFSSLRIPWAELRSVDPAGWRPRLVPFIASLLVLLAAFVYSVALWARLIAFFEGPKLPLTRAIGVFFVANLGRYIPGKLWQLVGLAYLSSREGVSPTVAASAAVLGQLFSLAAAALLAGLALAFGALSGLPTDVLPWAAALVILIGLVTSVRPVLRYILRLAFRLGRETAEVPELDRWFGARWTALYLPSWLGQGVAFGLLWASIPALPEVYWPAAVGIFAGAYFLGYAALFAPAGIGVREGAMAVALAPWTGPAQAVILSVVARVWMTLGELIPILGIIARRIQVWARRTFGVRDHAS